MELITAVSCTSINNVSDAKIILDSLTTTAAFDFETASKWSDDTKLLLKADLELTEDREERRIIQQKIDSDGLSHPSLVRVTHMSMATSPRDGYVFIMDNDDILDYCMNWLVTTNIRQIWHNASFDFKQIYHHTGQFPKLYEDSQQLAKSLINHVETFKANTQLKHLMGYAYGAWGLTEDYFNVSNLYDETLLLYAATDACATYSLWETMQHNLKEQP